MGVSDWVPVSDSDTATTVYTTGSRILRNIIAMKLVYVTLGLALLASTSDARRRRRPNRRRRPTASRCTDASGFMQTIVSGQADAPDADERQERAIAHWQSLDHDWHMNCEAVRRESERLMNSVDLRNPISGNCNAEADHFVGCILADISCDAANAGECTGTERECAGRSNGGDSENNGDVVNGIVGAMGIDVPEVEAEEDEQDQGMSGAGRNKKFMKQNHEVSDAIGKASGKVWNVVVSGGPEYCKDMFPRFPRILSKKINPSNPNWYMIKDVRDSCVTLLKIIRTVKCVCQYLLWKPLNWPKMAGGGARNEFGKRTGHVCYYLSQLKGSFVRPPVVRRDPYCNHGSAAGKEANEYKNKKPGNKPATVTGTHGTQVMTSVSDKATIGLGSTKYDIEEIKKMSIEDIINTGDWTVCVHKAWEVYKMFNKQIDNCVKKYKAGHRSRSCMQSVQAKLDSKLQTVNSELESLWVEAKEEGKEGKIKQIKETQKVYREKWQNAKNKAKKEIHLAGIEGELEVGLIPT